MTSRSTPHSAQHLTPHLTRYALYFAPSPASPWWTAGCRWLGRDAITDTEFTQMPIPGISLLALAKWTYVARRYGFHATLKAPFRLANGFSESDLATMAQAFSATQTPFVLEPMQVQPLGDFLALRPSGAHEQTRAMAMRCVRSFDALRAPLTAAELAQRRKLGLTDRQEILLTRWGYPYTEEEFHFHMTLTDGLRGVRPEIVEAIRLAAEEHFAAAIRTGSPVIDALTIFREEQPGAPFCVWRRFPFRPAQQDVIEPSATIVQIAPHHTAGATAIGRNISRVLGQE